MKLKQHQAASKSGGKKGIEKPKNIRVIGGKKPTPSIKTGNTRTH